MDKKTQEKLYQQLMLILTLLEEKDMKQASSYLEDLIEKVKFNQI